MKISFACKQGKTSAQSRSVAATLVVIILLSFMSPAVTTATVENTPKQEVVYANLEADGKVSKLYVVNAFELDEGGQVTDYGDYRSVKNLTSEEEIELRDGTVKVEAKPGRLYYEGTLAESAIPWNFEVHYSLDGIEYAPAELAGRSGALKIWTSIRENHACEEVFFDHYALQVSFTLDTDRCKNIVAEGATQANVGRKKQLTYTILPGQETEFAIYADVTDFEMAGISINGLPLSLNLKVDLENNEKLKEGINEIKDAVVGLDDGANGLKDGISAFDDGVGSLSEGAGEIRNGAIKLNTGLTELQVGTDAIYDGSTGLNDGAGRMTDAANALHRGAEGLEDGVCALNAGMVDAVSGMSELCDGTSKLSAGAYDLSSGTTDLYRGLKMLSLQNDMLLKGAYNVFAQLTSQAQTLLNASLEALGSKPVALTVENYDSVISGLLADFYDMVYSAAEQAVRSQTFTQAEMVGKQAGSAEPDHDITALTEERVKQELERNEVYQSVLKLKEGLNAYEGFYTGLQQYTAGVGSAAAGAASVFSGASELSLAAQTLNSGAGEMYDGLVELQGGAAELLSGTTTLKDGTAELYNGAVELGDGTETLLKGVTDLRDGVTALRGGSLELSNETLVLLDSTMELRKGTTELYKGVSELADGTTKFKERTSNLDGEVKEMVNAAIDGVLGGKFDPVSFVSEKNTNVESVQFVIKTEDVSVAEPVRAEPEQEETLSFWQRLLRLFGLS